MLLNSECFLYSAVSSQDHIPRLRNSYYFPICYQSAFNISLLKFLIYAIILLPVHCSCFVCVCACVLFSFSTVHFLDWENIIPSKLPQLYNIEARSICVLLYYLQIDFPGKYMKSWRFKCLHSVTYLKCSSRLPILFDLVRLVTNHCRLICIAALLDLENSVIRYYSVPLALPAFLAPFPQWSLYYLRRVCDIDSQSIRH